MRLISKHLALCAGFLAIFALSAAAQEHKHHHSHEAQASETSGPNALKEEMAKLDMVFREIVSGVALGDGKKVHSAIETLHGAMEKTQEAVHAGEVSLAKNANRVDEFIALDKEFHGNLEKLASAAQSNSRNKMLLYTKKLLDGCVKCHGAFRK